MLETSLEATEKPRGETFERPFHCTVVRGLRAIRERMDWLCPPPVSDMKVPASTGMRSKNEAAVPTTEANCIKSHPQNCSN